MAGVVHVKTGPTYAGGFTIPDGVKVTGQSIGTLVQGGADCGEVDCVVVVSKAGHLENFDVVAQDQQHGVQLRPGGNAKLSHVKVRGGAVGILVQGSAELAVLQATDTETGMQVDVAAGESPALVRFSHGYYTFGGATKFGILVRGEATIDMSALQSEDIVDFTGADVGMLFEARGGPPKPAGPVSVIRSAGFVENRVGLVVHKNVPVRVRESRFVRSQQPSVQLRAPNYTDLGLEQEPGGNLFLRENAALTGVALIMLCDQPQSNTPRIAAEGNDFPGCPLSPVVPVTYSGQVSSCPLSSSAADVVAYFSTGSAPATAAVNAGCR